MRRALREFTFAGAESDADACAAWSSCLERASRPQRLLAELAPRTLAATIGGDRPVGYSPSGSLLFVSRPATSATDATTITPIAGLVPAIISCVPSVCSIEPPYMPRAT